MQRGDAGDVCGQEDSCPDYMRKAEECLRQEEERVDGYLHMDSKPKLLKQVETEVLANYETQLLEKENSGCASLLRDDKVRTPLLKPCRRRPRPTCAPRRRCQILRLSGASLARDWVASSASWLRVLCWDGIARSVAGAAGWLGIQEEDLGRMYRLFSRIPKGLDPVADAFKRHVESEGMKLVKEVTETASQKKEAGGEPSALQDLGRRAQRQVCACGKPG